MSSSDRTQFVSHYLMSLLERTRQEKGSLKIGFDWVMYNLAVAKDWTPIRLPFIRQSSGESPKAKVEPEHGIDMSFLLPDRQSLAILVLKDEPLTYSSWTTHKFDSDIRMAASPDLSNPDLSQVLKVQVVLAYNKDEDQAGVQAFNNLTTSLGSRIQDRIALEFDRWNLTKITEMVEQWLMTPDLLPQKLAGILHYLCKQIGSFEYESTEWASHLAPNWKHFLESVLAGNLDERKIRLIPVALFILHEFRKNSRNAEAGWISLIESAMLSLWEKSLKVEKRELKGLIEDLWVSLYLAQLKQYVDRNRAVFTAEHGFQHGKFPAFGLSAIADANVAYWHLGRLGILTLGTLELMDPYAEDGKKQMSNIAQTWAKLLAECLVKNPAASRPTVDLHHIELFLVWYMLWVSGNMSAIYSWLSNLESRLLVRKTGFAKLPFIESRNRMDLVAEYAAQNDKPQDFSDKSSYLLLMILELCFSLPSNERDELVFRYVRRIIKGIGDDGKKFDQQQVDLVGWSPPGNWFERILGESVTDGTAITLTAFDSDTISKENCVRAIEDHVTRSRERFPFSLPDDLPKAALVLACIRHRSPLPSEFWRCVVFPRKTYSTTSK